MAGLQVKPGLGEQRHPVPGQTGTEHLLSASRANADQLLTTLGTSRDGLTEAEVRRRRRRFGRNRVAQETAPTGFRLLAGNFKNPFVLVLAGIGVVSYLTGDRPAVVVIAIMVAVSVLMRFLQEYRSSKAAEKLRSLVRTTATVQRRRGRRRAVRSEKHETPFEDLVPGDILHLSAGDMIPADVRLLESKDLFVSQSALTGESMPVEKSEKASETEGGELLERNNLCFLGTAIVSGSAVAVVVATGAHTYFGSLAQDILGHRALTSFDRGVNRVTGLLIRFILVMVPLIFLINGFVKHNWHEAFLFAVAVAVGLTPEMLPMVVTANLARGAVAMARRKVIVKRLNAIQNFGAMDVLCTDKTGTLTHDKIVLERHLNVRFHDDTQVLRYAYLNSYYQTGLKNLLDRAVLEHVEMEHQLQVPHAYAKVDEVPFDFGRRRMSVVVRAGGGDHLLICKGAVKEVLAVCTRAADAGTVIPLSAELRKHIAVEMDELNGDGLRVVAVAYKALPARDEAYAVNDENELVLAGFVAFLDPPKESAGPALAALAANGIQLKVLTGDNDIVTRKVCQDVGLHIEHLALGSDVEGASDEELADLVERATVFAKLTPAQKSRVIRALQGCGHTVGFLGDGINDAPALRDADVGISVDTAADIARESADILLTEKSLLVLEEGVLCGRAVYGNIIKYIKMAASSNFGNALSILVASIFLPFLPLLPIQVLIQNLLYDLSQLALPWDRMDNEFLTQPRKWEAQGIARFMFCIGPLSSVFDMVTFLVLWFVFRWNSEATQSFFQSGWFVEGLLSQALIVHMIRTKKIPFVQSSAASAVTVLTVAVMALGMWLPFSPYASIVGMSPLPAAYFSWLAGILLGYCLLTQIVKSWYIRRFQTWL